MLPRLILVMGLTIGTMLPLVWAAFGPAQRGQVSEPMANPAPDQETALSRDSNSELDLSAQATGGDMSAVHPQALERTYPPVDNHHNQPGSLINLAHSACSS